VFRLSVIVSICLALIGCSEIERRELGATTGPESVFDRDLGARFGSSAPRTTGSIGGGAGSPAARVYHGEDGGFGGSEGSGATAVGGGSYELNFEGAETAAVAKVVLGDILALNYAIDPRVSGTISFSSVRPVAKKDILPLFESALKLSGAMLYKEGPLYKVLPAGEATAGGGVDTGGRIEPGFGTSVMPMRWVSAQAVAKTIDGFAARPGSVRVDQARNLLIVQGSGPERRSLLDTALSLDVDFMKNQSVGIFPVSNGNPEAIVGELQNIFDAGKDGGGQDTVRFQAMPRLGAILVVARSSASIERVRTWMSRLDRSDYADGTLRVYRLKYGSAKTIASLLRDVFGGSGGESSGGSSSTGTGLAPDQGTRRSSSAAGSSGASAASGSSGFGTNGGGGGGGSPGMFNRGDLGLAVDGESGGGGRGTGAGGGSTLGALGEGRDGSGQVRITADLVNNSVIVSAPREQFRLIERTIKEMDSAPAQVAIEATIAEVTLKNDLQYGVQFYLRDKGGSSIGLSNGTSIVPAPSTPGFNAILGPSATPRVIINALRTITEVKVLSSPSLVVVNNQTATLEVGDQVPITTRQVTSTESTTAPTINSIDYRDTGVILKVLPRVAANGAVNIEVEQEVSNVVGAGNSSSTTSDTLTPTISQRRIRSAVTVMSGQTIVLGGMIGSRQEKSKSGLPFLGELGRSLQTDTGGTNTEIIVFIRPQVIRDPADAQSVSEEFRNKLTLMRRDAPVRAPIVVKY
jgi:general secretion pathway protein D